MNSAMLDEHTAKVAEAGVESAEEGWKRFERAVDAALHTAPKHRTATPPKSQKPKSSRSKKGAETD
jgi:hypothetical protein